MKFLYYLLFYFVSINAKIEPEIDLDNIRVDQERHLELTKLGCYGINEMKCAKVYTDVGVAGFCSCIYHHRECFLLMQPETNKIYHIAKVCLKNGLPESIEEEKKRHWPSFNYGQKNAEKPKKKELFPKVELEAKPKINKKRKHISTESSSSDSSSSSSLSSSSSSSSSSLSFKNKRRKMPKIGRHYESYGKLHNNKHGNKRNSRASSSSSSSNSSSSSSSSKFSCRPKSSSSSQRRRSRSLSAQMSDSSSSSSTWEYYSTKPKGQYSYGDSKSGEKNYRKNRQGKKQKKIHGDWKTVEKSSSRQSETHEEKRQFFIPRPKHEADEFRNGDEQSGQDDRGSWRENSRQIKHHRRRNSMSKQHTSRRWDSRASQSRQVNSANSRRNYSPNGFRRNNGDRGEDLPERMAISAQNSQDFVRQRYSGENAPHRPPPVNRRVRNSRPFNQQQQSPEVQYGNKHSNRPNLHPQGGHPSNPNDYSFNNDDQNGNGIPDNQENSGNKPSGLGGLMSGLTGKSGGGNLGHGTGGTGSTGFGMGGHKDPQGNGLNGIGSLLGGNNGGGMSPGKTGGGFGGLGGLMGEGGGGHKDGGAKSPLNALGGIMGGGSKSPTHGGGGGGSPLNALGGMLKGGGAGGGGFL